MDAPPNALQTHASQLRAEAQVRKPRLVMKFGGTSMAGLERINRAADKIAQETARGYDVAVIVSAMAGETDRLVGHVRDISTLYDAREYDAVVAAGEQASAGLMALTLQQRGVAARSWLGWQIPIRTTAAHGAARIEAIETDALAQKFSEGTARGHRRFPRRRAGRANRHAGSRRFGHLRRGGRRCAESGALRRPTPMSTASTPRIRASSRTLAASR